MPIEYTDWRTANKYTVPTQSELKEQAHFIISEGDQQAYYRNYLRRNNLILNELYDKSDYQELLATILDGDSPLTSCDKDDVTGQLIHALIQRLEICSPSMEAIDKDSIIGYCKGGI